MNLHGLRIFYYVMKFDSITKAAAELHVSQPAVSTQLKKFEQELGISLFNKQGRGLEPTSFGIELASHAAILFNHERELISLVEAHKAGRKGKLHIAATYLPANFILPRWVASFKQRYPDIEIIVTTTNSTEAGQLVECYDADLAIFGGSSEDQSPRINWKLLTEDELWFVVAANHHLANQTVALAELMQEPFVMREQGSSTRARLLSLCQAHGVKKPDFGLQFNGLHEVIQAVIAGYGANFVSALAVEDAIKQGMLARVYVPNITVINKIAIGTRQHEQPSQIISLFYNFINLIES
ncbi:DNA-binding transcriptional regulator, LysR family [Amphibacillus marinus]|uniref:DNA-binding transcriptional regulator, LysR family n=1 Tax=Amphibacillus marinus TaxID=872970 RepID=A0A1H8PND1_9BACI|nr:LysR family transcriptional regulator [Amphibacillus marinus]SEO43218.1 DNA-binding transcriptional regulator, LysR family [Amphibacillus marinus]